MHVDVTDDQLAALAGGLHLRHEGGSFMTGRNIKASRICVAIPFFRSLTRKFIISIVDYATARETKGYRKNYPAIEEGQFSISFAYSYCATAYQVRW